MSDSSPDNAGSIADASQILFYNRIVISGTALFFYDYVLTFSTEISEIWNSKFSVAHAVFFLTRYSYMAQMMMYCAINLTPNPSETFCQVIAFNEMAWFVMSQIGLYGIFTLRTYALYQRHPFILAIGGVTSVANVGLLVYAMASLKPKAESSALGGFCTTDEPSNLFRIQLATAIIGFILDILVFALTLAKTAHHAKEMRKAGLGNGLGYFILRDGALYFLVNVLMDVMLIATQVATFLFPAWGIIGKWGAVVGGLDDPLIYVLINRLVLNLRQVSHKQIGNGPTIGTVHEPVFATNSFLGNLGAPLRVGPEVEDEIEDVGIYNEDEVVEECSIVGQSGIVEDP